MDERSRHEGDLFTRYETRIVVLELSLADLKTSCAHYWPIVEALDRNELVASKIAESVREQVKIKLSTVHILIGLAALFVPATVGAILTALLVRGHL